VITGFRIEQGGDLVLGIEGLSVLASAVNTALTANDSTALWNLLYGGADTITGGDTWGRANILFGHGGNDTLNGGTGGDWLNGGAGDDIVHGGDETDPSSNNYGDGIDGAEGNDTLYGGAGRDVIVGGDGSDLIEGGDGNDILYHDGDGLTATDAMFVLSPNPFPASIPVRGFLAGDRRAEDGAADTVNGGAGDDFIYLGVGDSADGGIGNDTVEVNFRGRTTALTLDMSAGSAAALTAASGGTYVNVERFDVVGTLFNDVITGGADSSILYGEAGEDRVDGGGGNDSVTGSAFTNSSRIGNVWGSRFDDGQQDTLFGGEGNDGVSVGLLDVADGGAGTDTLLVTLDGMNQGVSLDLTTGDRFAAIAAVTGGSYTNFETISTLHTTEYADVIRGLGVASIYTFGGDDTVHADDINNTLGLGDGDDLAYGMGGNDLILGGFGNDRLYGGAGSDTIYADVDYDPTQPNGSGADFLDGGDGVDSLYGGAGDDVIVGGVGGDRIFGEAGIDTVSYAGSTAGVSVQRTPSGMDPNTGEQAYVYSASGGDAQGDQLDSVEAVIGSDQNDQLTGFQTADGGAGADAVAGSHLADVLLGGAGDDRLAGLEGADTLNGGDGVDIAEYSRLSSGAGSTGVTVDLRIQGVAQNTGAAGSDTLISIEGVVGSFYADILHGDDQANYIQGAGDSSSQPGSGPFQGDQLFGHGGDDVIIGDGAAPGLGYTPGDGQSRGYDLISGGDGNDTITAGNGADVVNGDAGDDIIFGEWDGDTLDGGEGNDTIDGGSMDDTIRGGDGNDRLIGGSGADAIDGGAGIDTAVFSGARADYTFTALPNGSLRVVGPDGTDTLTGVERLQFSDGLFNPAGDRLPNEVFGTPNADTLTGTAAADMIYAEGGDDLITGGAGDDIIDGGAGFDTAVFATGAVPYTVTVSGGVVTVASSDGTDTLTNVERLRFGGLDLAVADLTGAVLIGTAAGDALAGGGGDDRFFGLAGNDAFTGGLGSDTADYSQAAGAVTARTDIQSASNDGDGGADTFTSIENLTGSAFDDLLVGDAGANILLGGLGRDVIIAGGGNDVINGGSGVPNELYGGAGDDIYIVENRADSIIENAGEGIDTILSAVFQIHMSANVENLTYTGTEVFTGIGNAVGNVITGGAQRDTLLGLGGDDILIGGAGAANELHGGAGDDTYVLDASDTIVEAVGDGTDTVQLRGLHAYNLAANVEHAVVIGTGDYVLNGNALDNTLTGGAGDDTLQGGGGNNTLIGGDGIDTVTYILASLSGVTARLDINRGINSNGMVGTDTFSGIENLTGSNHDDTLIGNAGDNVINGGIGYDLLLGFDGNDTLIGGFDNGSNEMYGGRGDDLYIAIPGDTLIELAGEGIDTVHVITSFTLAANIENLTYIGGGAFAGRGNAENNVITGGAGGDILSGLGGDDTLIGGGGDDLVILQGVRADYVITAVPGGWRVVDSVAGRDGTDTLFGMEILRFSDGGALALGTPPAAPAAEVMPLLSDKAAFDDAFVLPAPSDDDALVLPALTADKAMGADPLVLPGLDGGQFAFSLESDLGPIANDSHGLHVLENGALRQVGGHDWV
jgi:Ca2+-binding RTX toxin-like protein